MSLKKYLTISSLSVLALSCGTALAGTMGAAEPNWTGVYAGFNLGAAFGSSNTGDTVTNWSHNGSTIEDSQYTLTNQNNFNPAAGVIGAQLGYNWQQNHWLLGAETSFDYMKQTNGNTKTFSTSLADGTNFDSNNIIETNWLYTIRPRAGYLFNNFLIYGTGGLALTDLTHTKLTSDDTNNNFLAEGITPKTSAKTMVGWTAGGGVEWMFIPNKWTLSVQYLYTDFGTLSDIQQVNNIGQAGPGNTLPTNFTQTATLTDNVVTFGLNYLFS